MTWTDRPAVRVLGAVAGLLLLTACTSSGDSPGDGTQASSPATSSPPTSSPAASTSTSPTATGTPDPAAVPPADAQPCPAAYDTTAPQPWVPAEPGTETTGRLAPDADPVEVVLCRYAGGTGALDGPPVRLTDGLLGVRADLSLPPSDGCAAGGTGAAFLARLAYADGDLWVAVAPGGCTGNGVTVSAVSARAQLAASYDAGAWVPPAG